MSLSNVMEGSDAGCSTGRVRGVVAAAGRATAAGSAHRAHPAAGGARRGRAGQHWFRPDVGVLLARDGMPLDGVLQRAPSLVVRLGPPLAADAWLRAGADVVWAYEGDAVWEVTRRRRRMLTPDVWLTHPSELALRMPARELLPQPVRRARVAV